MNKNIQHKRKKMLNILFFLKNKSLFRFCLLQKRFYLFVKDNELFWEQRTFYFQNNKIDKKQFLELQNLYLEKKSNKETYKLYLKHKTNNNRSQIKIE